MGLLWDTPEERARKEQAQRGRAALLDIQQEPAIPQGGIDPAQYVGSEAYQPQYQQAPAEAYRSLLEAGYDDTQASKMMDLLQPQQAQQFSPMYKTAADELEAVNKLRTPYEKRIAAPRKAINNYNDAVDIVKNAEWSNPESPMLTGAESVALTKKYLKQVLPDESVMGDDIQTLLNSQGVSEQAKSLINRFLGDSGTISKEGASEIMRAMATMAQSGGVDRDLLRGQFTKEAQQYQVPTTFMT